MHGISLWRRKNWYRPRATLIAWSLVHGMAVKCQLKLSRMVRMSRFPLELGIVMKSIKTSLNGLLPRLQ